MVSAQAKEFDARTVQYALHTAHQFFSTVPEEAVAVQVHPPQDTHSYPHAHSIYHSSFVTPAQPFLAERNK